MTTVYVIQGSEDGVIGVATNAKKAVASALVYCHRVIDDDAIRETAATLRERGFVQVEEETESWNPTTCDVTQWSTMQ